MAQKGESFRLTYRDDAQDAREFAPFGATFRVRSADPGCIAQTEALTVGTECELPGQAIDGSRDLREAQNLHLCWTW